MKRQKRPVPLARETSGELQARLRRFVLASRDQAMRSATVPFPEHVTGLAGPLRKRKAIAEPTEAPDDSGQAPGNDSGPDDQQ